MEPWQKIAVVAGGAGGIGTEVVLRLARDNFSPIILDRDQRAGKEVLEALRSHGYQGHFIALELTQQPAVQEAFAHIVSQYGRVDVLANIAGGVIYPKLIQDFALNEWQEVN